jgi:hypothetical protein
MRFKIKKDKDLLQLVLDKRTKNNTYEQVGSPAPLAAAYIFNRFIDDFFARRRSYHDELKSFNNPDVITQGDDEIATSP